MSKSRRASAIFLLGTIAVGVLMALNMKAAWMTPSVYNLPFLGHHPAFWIVLGLIPGLLIGFASSYKPIPLSVLTYMMGGLLGFILQGGLTDINGVNGNFWPRQQIALQFFMRLILEDAVIGAVLGLLGYALRRLTIRLSGRAVHLR